MDASAGAVACTTGTEPGSRIEQWFPLTAGSHYYEAHYSQVWGAIGAQTPFPDTCLCEDFLDNGAGLSWDFTVPAGGSVSYDASDDVLAGRDGTAHHRQDGRRGHDYDGRVERLHDHGLEPE